MFGQRLTRTLRCAAVLSVLATGVVGTVPAWAQAVANGRTVYELAFFAVFSPATAADMVARVPGFSIDDGDEDVRGFSQAAGNVIINGQRPASKSDSLKSILARIPAKRVVRVEIAPGARFGSDYASKAQVANVIVTGGGISGLMMADVTRTYIGRLTPGGKLSVTATRGPSTFTAEVSNYYNNVPEEGSDTRVTLPSGHLIEYQRKINDHYGPGIQGSLGWALDEGQYRTAHLNFKADLNRYRLLQDADVTTGSGAWRQDDYIQRKRRRYFEIGGDVTRPLAGGGAKLVALATRTHETDRQLQRRDHRGMLFAKMEDSAAHYDSEETILRASWTRPDLAGWTVELGGEGALNGLAVHSRYRVAENNGPLERIPFALDEARIEEKRAELFVSAGRAFSPKLRADFTLAQEFSRLRIAGGADSASAGKGARTLAFLKPKASVEWRPGDRWLVRGSAARNVAQLTFMDFVSTVALGSNQVNGGNAGLEPQRAWEFRTSVERPIFGDGLARVELGYNAVEKVQDRVPVAGGYDAPGNLGAGRVYIAKSALDIPLSRFGLKGARFSASASIWDTHVCDPYTGRDRPFSNYSMASVDLKLQQDIGRWSWELGARANSPSTAFRRDEEDRFYQGFNRTSLTVAYRPDPATTIEVNVDNLFNVPAQRWRTFFTPDRSHVQPTAHEYRERNYHWLPSISIKRTFG